MRSLQIIFLLLVVFCLGNFVASAGAVRESERVEVKSGENIILHVKTPEHVNRVTLQKNCNNKTKDPIIRYCSTEEEKNGCTAKASKRISIKTDMRSLSVIFVHARVSDEGCYVVSYIDVENNTKEKLFNVTVHGSQENPEDLPNKGKETSCTINLKYLIIIAVGIVLLTAK